MNYQELATKIIELVGGSDNIQRVWNCMTRLRFNLIDDSIVKKEALRRVKGITDIQETQSQFQIIIGNHVDEIADEIICWK